MIYNDILYRKFPFLVSKIPPIPTYSRCDFYLVNSCAAPTLSTRVETSSLPRGTSQSSISFLLPFSVKEKAFSETETPDTE